MIDIGDSTSEGLTSPEYLPDRANRIEAQFDDIGATVQHYAFSGARSIVETYDGQTNAVSVVQAWKRVHYRGCWVLALGTNDAANIYVGSSVDPFTRIEQMMTVIGRQPVMWVNVKSLLTTGPYSEQNMQEWNDALLRACQDYPNMRVFDWSSVVQNAWFIDDGIHYNTPGYRARAKLIAEALGKAFPLRRPQRRLRRQLARWPGPATDRAHAHRLALRPRRRARRGGLHLYRAASAAARGRRPDLTGGAGRVRQASTATTSASAATTLPKSSKVSFSPRSVTTRPASTAGIEREA